MKPQAVIDPQSAAPRELLHAIGQRASNEAKVTRTSVVCILHARQPQDLAQTGEATIIQQHRNHYHLSERLLSQELEENTAMPRSGA